jgi:hypothetical protein
MNHAHRILRALTTCLVIGIATFSAHAKDLVWDGKTYLPIGLVLNSDFALTFPEPVYTSEEIPGAFTQTDFGDDGRTYIISPTRDVEQRVFFKGSTTGTIYIAKFSTKVPYAPIINVINAPPVAPPTSKASPSSQTPQFSVAAPAASNSARQAITSLMRNLMQGIPAQGYERSPADQLVLDAGAYKITAQEIWASARVTGMVVRISKSPSVASVKVHPADIQINASQLGDLRMFGADRWDLSNDSPNVLGYMIFSK